MEFHGMSWNVLRWYTYLNILKPLHTVELQFHNIPWKYFHGTHGMSKNLFHGRSMEFHVIPWNSADLRGMFCRKKHGMNGISMEFHGSSMEVPWNSMVDDQAVLHLYHTALFPTRKSESAGATQSKNSTIYSPIF